MDRERLVRTAAELSPLPTTAAEEYQTRRDGMVLEVDGILGERPDVVQLVGEGNLDMMRNNHANHGRFIGTILMNFDPEIMVDTVLWVFRAYRSHGFALTYWPAQLDAWVTVMRGSLSPESFEAIYPLYHWMIVNQPAFVALSDERLGTTTEPSHGEV